VFDGACGDDHREVTIDYASRACDAYLFGADMPSFYDVQFNEPHAIKRPTNATVAGTS